MANVKVAIRVRPLNSRESVEGGRMAVQVEDKVVRIKNTKLEGRGDSRERLMEFGFDYCYWSVDPEGPNYASQEEVFQDLGVSVLSGASEGYNVCLFAYGQTGSGKTYTMIGTPDSMGLTPRICQGLFHSGADASPEGQSSCRVEVSFLEIYNERVRDLLRSPDQKKPAVLRVREHPETGPYVQGLSQHRVTDYKQALEILERGIGNRITAATHVHDASSRSHAIFTIQYTQATLENNLPSEIVSKINLVDLAGSERADPHYCRDRITEGANINKSLVTLGIVISALAQNSQMFSSCQSINSVASEGEGSLGGGSLSSSLSGSSSRRHCFIPYRDSVLTWLLKDSLGGNSKTIMIATVAPSCSSYNETLSTLRYAAHARNIVNKPKVNEDANVRLIRELREEIDRLKTMLLSFEMQRDPSPSLSDERDGSLSDIVLQNELKVDQLTKDWSEGWSHKRELLEAYSMDIDRDRAGFLVHALVPHLIALDRDVLSTGVTFYHLREGLTRIGPRGNAQEELQIVLLGGTSCEIENQCGVVTLRPLPGQVCIVNGREVTEPCRLAQGAVISLGQYKFRFNHPAEAAVLRERRRTSDGALSCSPSELGSLSAVPSVEGAGCPGDAPPPWQRVEEQQRYVELLHEEIQVEQRKADRDLEIEQAHLKHQQSEIEQWILKQKQRLTAIEQKVTQELGVQTELVTPPVMDAWSGEADQEGSRPPSVVVGDHKQVVQEELLRHHALHRAENRVRRKRLHYQLQRIARKRHLLEAKGELQRLMNSVPPGQEGPLSPEFDSSSRGRTLLRRHSFSTDLLSRLFPQHTPIFCQFLKRNKSSEFMSFYQGSFGPRKYSSDEWLPDQPMRGRSHTLPSGYGRGTRSRAGSCENLKAPLREKNTTETCRGKSPGTKTGPSRRGSLPRSRSNSQSKSTEDTTTDANSKAMKRHVPIISKGSLQKNSSKGAKNSSNGSNKRLETIRKVFSRSVGPGIKTALARVFRKPPLGLRSGRGAKTFKSPWKLTGKPVKDREASDDTEERGHGPLKATVSLDNLQQTSTTTTTATPEEDAPQKRRWHSAEALSPQSRRCEGRQQDLVHWIENLHEEEGNLSDCDSLFSVDSLSSAYAVALAEQLRQEEVEREHSETESVDSHMSEDSLVMDSSGKHATVRPAVTQVQVPSHVLSSSKTSQPSKKERTTVESQQRGRAEEVVGEASDEMPAEVYWSLGGTPKLKARRESGGTPGPAYEKQPCADRSHGDDKVLSKMSEEPASCPPTMASTPRSLSSSSVREPESLLALTDAWSSMDTADSPRIAPSSGRRTACDLLKGSDRSLSSSSSDLSDHTSGSELQRSLSAESTEGENTMLQGERYWEPDRSVEQPVSCCLRTSSEVVLRSGNTLTLCCEAMVNESDELLNSQHFEGELRHKESEVMQCEEVFVNETQLVYSHVTGAHGEMIWSEETQPRADDVPNKVEAFDKSNNEYMAASKQSNPMDLTPTSVKADVSDILELVPECPGRNADVSDILELVPECPGMNAHVSLQGSAGTSTVGYVAEDVRLNEAKESFNICRTDVSEVEERHDQYCSQVENMCLCSCDVEHHVHDDEPQAGLTPKSTLKGIPDQCLQTSSHYLHSTASGSVLASEQKQQSSLDVPEEAQIHHGTSADVIGSPNRVSGESTKIGIDHAVEGYIETTCKGIPADAKDLPVSIKAQQNVLDSFGHVTCCTAAETSQNQESELHNTSCRKSRKRIKDSQDAFTSTLKFPKRCHSPPAKPIHVTPNKTDKDHKENYNKEVNESFKSKDEHTVEKKSCPLSEAKCVAELSVAEKNSENEVKTPANAKPGRFDTNDSYIINKKISEVVQKHLEMSIDSGNQEGTFSVTNSDSTKSLKDISDECIQHNTDSAHDYCPTSSQTVSLLPQSLKLNENCLTKDVPSCSHRQDFGSTQIPKDQRPGCGTREVNTHMDTKSLRSSAGRTSEESLNKGSSVLLQQDIPKELQMDSCKSKQDIMPCSLKEAGKAVQSDVCHLSAKLEKGTLSAGSSIQHTESLKVANMEKHKASVMTERLGVSESSPARTVEATVGESATLFAKSEFTEDIVNSCEIPPEEEISNVSLSVLCPGEGDNEAWIDEASKERAYSQRMNILTEKSDLYTKSKFVATEVHPVDLNGQNTGVSHLSDPLKQTGEMCMLESHTKQPIILFSQAEHMLDQLNQSKHSQADHMLDQHNQSKNSQVDHMLDQHNQSKHSQAEHMLDQLNQSKHSQAEHMLDQHNQSKHSQADPMLDQHNQSKNSQADHMLDQHNQSKHSQAEHMLDQHNQSKHSQADHMLDQHNQSKHSQADHMLDQHNQSKHSQAEHMLDQHNQSKHSQAEHMLDQHNQSKHSQADHMLDQHNQSKHSQADHMLDQHNQSKHSQAEHMLDQHNQSKHSQTTFDLVEHSAQNLNTNVKTFSSHMTIKVPQQRNVETNESSIGNSNTLKYQEIIQGDAIGDSSNLLLGAEEAKVGQDCLQGIQKGDHNGSALSLASCHRPPHVSAALQAQTDPQQEHFQHAELTVLPLSRTYSKQFSTPGPRYINKIELEVSCNGEHSADGSEEMLLSEYQLTSQEQPSFLRRKNTEQSSQEVTSNLKVKSEVSVDICGPRRTQYQMSEGSEDTDSIENSRISGYTSRLTLAKPMDCKDNKIADNQKVKTKKFRRAQVTAPPSSSSESVPDSSSNEDIPDKMCQHRSSARPKPEAQICDRQKESRLSRLGPQFTEDQRLSRLGPQFTEDQKSKTPSSQNQFALERKVKERHHLQSPSSRIALANAKSSCAPVLTQQDDDKQNFFPTRKEPKPAETLHLSEKKVNSKVVSPVNENQCKITDDTHLKHILNVSKQLRDTPLDNDTLKKEDAVLHFASIDINPFLHPWQDTESNKPTYKNQVFGSAAEICSKYPLLNCPDRQITRCLSVDNGLNVQNAPFNSHLSTYANSKGLSSTLSSVEDFKEQVGTQSNLLACCHTSLDANGLNLTAVSYSSSYSEASGDLGNSSGQVDEIMLVYPSEQDSQSLENQSISMCNHSTQTVTPGGDSKRRRCHHRSSTQVETTLEGKVPATWASLQNMSAHLSELIHNTSDLLGNIQCMRTGPTQRQEHMRKTRVSNRYPRHTNRKDGSTQTTLDIGIQTEGEDSRVNHSTITHKAPITDTHSTAHEVNVIVKVIGPNSLSVSEGNDITLSLYDRGGSGRLSENIKSMPDLRENRSRSAGRMNPKGTPVKVPSLETVLPGNSYITPDVSPIFTKDLNFDKVSPSGFGFPTVRRCSSQIDVPESQTPLRNGRNYSSKQVSFTDRASSPILTVEVGVGGQEIRTSTPCHDTADSHTEKQMYTSRMTSPRNETLQTTSTQSHPGELHDHDLRKTYSSSDISIGTISTGHISDLSKSTSDVSNAFLTISSQGKKQNCRAFSHRNTSEKVTGQTPFHRPPYPQNPKWVPSPSHSSSSYQQPVHDRQARQLFSSFDHQGGRSNLVTETPHRVPEDLGAFWNGPFELPDTCQEHILEHQEDDLMSVAPSECNTDVLVSINPLTETLSRENRQLIPEDLPLHNKFSNWSGLSQYQPTRLIGSTQRPNDKRISVQNPLRKHSQSESLSSNLNPNPVAHKDDRMREIERLRKERETVMASVQLEMNPHQLTVEMAEAKLHYGLGETDALLKVLKSGPSEQSPPLTKQHLYDRHRKSIEGLSQERDARLQTCRRARSLSPSKHGGVLRRDPDSSPKSNDTPTRRREYLQQLRQEVVETSRVPEPPRREGQCPSEIEILLRDYSRAREEARTEIARARDRLRERTEQEKRRLQQQTLSQMVRDDLRFRNRVSNSTLCTGSSLSLASSPTSGYNSSNPAILRDMQGTSALEMGSKVVARPPIGGSQSLRSQRTWTSAQDIRLEQQGSGSDPHPSSSPSSPPPSLRQRALSFGSPSSLATAYHDIASRALTHALAEVRLASAGELSNLLAGKSAAGWRHQGSERGVQVFHKPGPRATVHGFLGAMELERPVQSLWSVIRDQSKTHLYNSSVSSSWTRALDETTQLVYMLSKPSSFNLKQPRDFCCISTEAKQDERWVLAMQSVYEESLPRPSVDAVRAEVLPSAWILQPIRRHGQERVNVIYMLQVDLGPPALPHRLLGAIARKQASVIAELDAFFSL
ncbi:stAR-related lipid transfer protein 9 [Clupea harengus]|uniref:StAR-related lipid transfer protein 9 n=1 Tax=Clupea harengus TaxID=7950 RepID=A0A6P8GKC8_CLUHA|nr:stAR-related lipid transfer protein 9 [Clupea harengus]